MEAASSKAAARPLRSVSRQRELKKEDFERRQQDEARRRSRSAQPRPTKARSRPSSRAKTPVPEPAEPPRRPKPEPVAEEPASTPVDTPVWTSVDTALQEEPVTWYLKIITIDVWQSLERQFWLICFYVLNLFDYLSCRLELRTRSCSLAASNDFVFKLWEWVCIYVLIKASLVTCDLSSQIKTTCCG